MERRLDRPDGLLVVPDGSPPTFAMLVLSGSSGRVEEGRVRLLARSGVAASSIRWFGGPGQAQGICELPLESLSAELDRLADLGEHLAVMGVSKGAEAALLLAADDPRIRAVIALSPTSVVWANVGPGIDGREQPDRSSWTRGGRPLPFVPFDRSWTAPAGSAPAFRTHYERSLAMFPAQAREAAIPVERITADVISSAGGDDQVWPSTTFATAIAERRAACGLPTTTLISPLAGHRITFPGEPPITSPDRAIARGGTPEADAELGRRVWQAMTDVLGLRATRT